jgi:hypothetical protein
MVCPAIVRSNSLQVLCCFVITAPFASSTATEEEQKCKEILRILEGQAPLDLPEILNISQTAIDYLFCQTLLEPSNRALLSPTVDNSTSLKYNVINQKIHFGNSGWQQSNSGARRAKHLPGVTQLSIITRVCIALNHMYYTETLHHTYYQETLDLFIVTDASGPIVFPSL